MVSLLKRLGRRESSDQFRQQVRKLDRGAVFPHRRDDLDTGRQTRSGATNWRDGGGQPRQGSRTDPGPHVPNVWPCRFWRLDDTVVDWLAMVVGECRGERRREKEHVVALEVPLPQRAD